MTAKSRITDGDGSGLEAHVHPFTTSRRTDHAGLLILTHPFLAFNPEFHPFLNDDFGVNMNQNLAFGGTPDRIHDGIDTSTLYTGSNISGSKVTFNQDDEQAHGGIVTIVNFNNLGSDTVTVGVDGSDTTKSEPGDWSASGSNGATATSLASALNGITGVSASATAAVVTVTADSGSSITKLDVSDSDNSPGTGRAVKVDSPSVNDVWQFDKGSDVTIANFTAFSAFIFVDKQWATGDSVEMYCYDTGSAVEVGERIQVEDFINETDFDVWQSFVVPFSAFNFIETTFDAVRFEYVAKSGGAPVFFIDDFQVEQTGTPAVFKATTPIGTRFYITELRIRFEDAFDSTLANATVPNIPIDAFLGVGALTNGIVFRRVQKGKTLFSVTLRNIGDFLATGSNMINLTGNATNTGFTLLVEFPEPIVLEGGESENFLSFTVSDDLSGLTRLTAAARGALEI